jgi:hypothetical protein
MELWLALFGLAAAVLMIWSARKRHRDTAGGGSGSTVGGAAHTRNGDGHDGNGNGGGGD